MASATRKKTSTSKQPAPPSWRRAGYWLGLLFVLGALGAVALSGYLIRLDEQIRTRFAGVRWALPAQVFAAPMELYPGLRLAPADLVHELQRLGYREDPHLGTTGSYMPGRGRVDMVVRAFDFWDGRQDAQRVGVLFNGGEIEALDAPQAPGAIGLLRLDPMLIGSIYPQQGEDRVLVRLAEVPPLLVRGLVAVEDRQFYDHHGVSLRSILRASLVNLRAGRVVQGGSTITQQLIKNFFLTSRQTWGRKLNEALMAVLLERHFAKDEILEAYLNEVNIGQDGSRSVHGFGLGAHFFFNKPLSELEPQEIALLIGLVKGPSYYNPRRNPQRARERRDLVLGVLHDNGLLDDAAYQRALTAPLGVDAGRPPGGVERYPAFVDLVQRQLRRQYQEHDLTHEGLRIFTTLDPRAQEALERRAVETLPQIERSRRLPADTLETAGVIVNADSGDVQALIGGRQVRYPGFNRALDALRPIGSLVKPFIYLTALERSDQFTLASILPDDPIDLKLPTGQTWSPRNYDRKLHGPQPLFRALAQSYNLPTVHLGLTLTPKKVLATLRLAGYSGDAQALPSMLLGAIGMPPLEVAQMYATLAAGGFRAPLSAIRAVQTPAGEILSRAALQVQPVLPEAPVYLTDWALRRVVSEGTARALQTRLPGATLAGKTGTTDDYRDAWFAGYADGRVAVIWVGRDDNKPTGLSGASGALPVWGEVMADLGAGHAPEPLPPGQIETALIDLNSGLRADRWCEAAIELPFIIGSTPQQPAPCARELGDPLDWFFEVFGRRRQ